MTFLRNADGQAAGASQQQSGAPSRTQYSLSLDAVLRVLRYPRYMLQVKGMLGDQAELLMDELVKSGQETASKLLLRSLVRQRSGRDSQGGGIANGTTISSDANQLYRHFKALVEARYYAGGDERTRARWILLFHFH